MTSLNNKKKFIPKDTNDLYLEMKKQDLEKLCLL